MNTEVKPDIKKLQANLKSLPGALPDRVIQKGLIAAARTAQKAARTPNFAFTDKTGHTRKSIKAGAVSKRDKRSKRTSRYAGLSIGGPGAKQGPLLELGTDKMSPRAPLRRAVEDTLAQAWRVSASAMEKAFAKLESDALKGKLSRAELKAAVE